MRISDWSSDVCSSDLVADASRKAKELVQWATELQREPCSINELWVSTKCGESDTTSGLASNPTVGNFIDKFDDLGATTCFGETSELTGAAQVCATRAATPDVAKKFLDTWQAYMDEVIKPHKTRALSDKSPTQEHIAGCLHTPTGKLGTATCRGRGDRC